MTAQMQRTVQRVERWRRLVGAVLSTMDGPKPTHAQLMGQIHTESGGLPAATSDAAAVGLLQIIPDPGHDATPPWLRWRPGRMSLLVPAINVAVGAHMMADAMSRAKNAGLGRGPSEWWRHSLLEFYTGSMTGWARRPMGGGPSGADYVERTTTNAGRYLRPPGRSAPS